jgi:UDP-N-acetyl-D-mannosaminuronate dehydrogenase
VDTLSPAYALRDELNGRGAMITLEDPFYTREELHAAGFEPGTPAQADLVVLNTAHPQFLNPDFLSWREQGLEAVLDGRNAWQQREAEQAGLLYFGIGRPSRRELAHHTLTTAR